MNVDRRGFARPHAYDDGVPDQVLMEYNQGQRPVPSVSEFLDCKNRRVWPNGRPGLGVSVDEKQLTFIEAMTEAVPGPTHRRLDGSLTHW